MAGEGIESGCTGDQTWVIPTEGLSGARICHAGADRHDLPDAGIAQASNHVGTVSRETLLGQVAMGVDEVDHGDGRWQMADGGWRMMRWKGSAIQHRRSATYAIYWVETCEIEVETTAGIIRNRDYSMTAKMSDSSMTRYSSPPCFTSVPA